MQFNNSFENSSDNQIIQKNSLEELTMWISHLNYVADECDNFAKIAAKNLNNNVLSEKFLEIIKDNASLLNDVTKYKSATDHIIECIDLECDLFYHTEFTKIRLVYKNHLDSYRALKEIVFLSLHNEG